MSALDNRNGIRGIRQTIPSGFLIGRSSPGSSQGPAELLPLPPINQRPIISGSGGKATQGGAGQAGTVGTSVVSVTAGTGISVSGAPAYTVSLQVPVTVADGGTNATSASGTALDNITGFSSTGILKRTGAGTYTFIADGQLPATATNDNAAAGKVGEYISSQITVAGAIALANNTQTAVTSISLTAGDWDVTGNVNVFGGGASITLVEGAINSASSFPDESLRVEIPFANTSNVCSPVPGQRFSLSTTTTIYLMGYATYTGGSGTTIGGLLQARRAR